MVVQNFVVLHRSGDILFQAHYCGEALDATLITSLSLTAFASFAQPKSNNKPVSNNANTSKSEQQKNLTAPSDGASSATPQSAIAILTVSARKFVFLHIGSYLLVVQSVVPDNDAFMMAILRQIERIVHFHCGVEFESASNAPGVIDASFPIIDSYLKRSQSDLSVLSDGVSRFSPDESGREQLDRFMSQLEEHEQLIGSALLLESSLVHARGIVSADVRMISEYLVASPLGLAKVRSTPVYLNQKWRHLILLRIKYNVVLAVLTELTCKFSSIAGELEEFEEQLLDSSVQIPSELPIVPLRQFTGLDTIAFVYRNSAGVKVVPALRTLPEADNKRVVNAFLWFYSRISDIVSVSGGANDITLNRDGFRYHAHVDDAREIHVMFGDNVLTVESSVKEIIANVERILPLA